MLWRKATSFTVVTVPGVNFLPPHGLLRKKYLVAVGKVTQSVILLPRGHPGQRSAVAAPGGGSSGGPPIRDMPTGRRKESPVGRTNRRGSGGIAEVPEEISFVPGEKRAGK